MELRVEQLAAAADVSVDTVRFYQGKGLLPPPRRSGRAAWYGEDHLERLRRIRSMQSRGLTLATIRRLLDGELDAADQALAEALSGPAPTAPAAPGTTATMDLEALAERTGIPAPLLQAVEREGLLLPLRTADGPRYTDADADVARAGLALLEQGFPLPDLLELARMHHEAVRGVAERAVELFDEHVRTPLRAEGLPDEEAAERLVAAFHRLLPATVDIVAHHFRRVLVQVALEHVEAVGADVERERIREEAARDPEGAAWGR